MVEFEYIIKNPVGLHMRPAKELIKLVSCMNSEVYIISEDKEIKVNSILRIVTAGITSGKSIRIKVVGGDYIKNAKFIEEEICKIL